MLARATLPSPDRARHHVQQWRARQRRLTSALQSDQSTEWGWLWAIRQRIFRFLLARYDQPQADDSALHIGDEVKPTTLPRKVKTEPTLTATESIEPYASWQPSSPPTVPADMGKPIRSIAALHHLTHDLAQANNVRHSISAIETQLACAEQADRLQQAQHEYILQRRQLWLQQHDRTIALATAHWQDNLVKCYLQLAFGLFSTLAGFSAPLLAQLFDPPQQYPQLALLIALIPLGVFLIWFAMQRIERIQRVIKRIAQRAHLQVLEQM